MVVAEHPFLDARIFKKEAISLRKKGYDVTMIVPRKKGHLFDIDGTPFTKTFRNKVFTHEGIKIITYHFESSRSGLNNVLSDEAIWEKQGFNNPLTRLGVEEDADIYHAHEYLSLFAGVGIKRLLKKTKGKDVKLIYDSHELTPDPLDSRYSEEHREKLKQKLLLMLNDVDHVITVSESIKDWYTSHKPNLPVEIIYNSPPLAKDYLPKQYGSNQLTVCFEGHLDDKEWIKQKIIDMTDICSKQMDFHFKIIGGSRLGEPFPVPEHLQHRITETGWIDYKTIPNEMIDVDIGLIDIGNVEQSLNREYAMPNKFFSYLNNGLPVLVNKSHDMSEFIRKHECGYVVEKTNASATDYAEAIIMLNSDRSKLQQLSHNSRKIMEDLYSWEKMAERLYRIYENLFVTDNNEIIIE